MAYLFSNIDKHSTLTDFDTGIIDTLLLDPSKSLWLFIQVDVF